MSSKAAYFPDAVANASDALLPSSDKGATGRSTRVSSETSEASDDQLMEQVSEESKNALAQLFRKYAPTVRNVAFRILRDESEADDLVQEVFLYLFQKAALFDASKGTAISWIVQIAYHRAINRRQYLTVRHHYKRAELDNEQIAAGRQSPSIDAISAKKLLDELRERLSAEEWQTLELHYFEGYSLREIAEKTGESLGNTRHHFYRALDRLRASVFPEKGV